MIIVVVKVADIGEEAAKGLTEDTLAHIGIYKNGRAQESLAGYVAASCAVKLFATDTALPTEFSWNNDGKPSVKGDKIFISVSHCGEYAAATASEYPVGIDIENFKTCRMDASIAILDWDSYNYYKSLEFPENRSYLIARWCLKESYIKCTGKATLSTLRNIPVVEETDGYSVGEGIFGAARDYEKCCLAYVSENKDVVKAAIITTLCKEEIYKLIGV